MRQKTLLVVDDEETVRKVLGRYFTKAGQRVLIASDGAQALDILSRESPDLMFLDIRMPGMGGLDVLRCVRTLRPKLPVLMVTAVEDEATAKQSMELGARDYILKPLDLDYLDSTAKVFSLLGQD